MVLTWFPIWMAHTTGVSLPQCVSFFISFRFLSACVLERWREWKKYEQGKCDVEIQRKQKEKNYFSHVEKKKKGKNLEYSSSDSVDSKKSSEGVKTYANISRIKGRMYRSRRMNKYYGRKFSKNSETRK